MISKKYHVLTWTYQTWSYKLNWIYYVSVWALSSRMPPTPSPLFLADWEEEPCGFFFSFLFFFKQSHKRTFLVEDNSWPVFLLLWTAFFKNQRATLKNTLVDEDFPWQVGWNSLRIAGRNCINDNHLEVIQIPISIPRVSNFFTLKPFGKWIKCGI